MKLTRKVLSALGAIFLAALLLVALAPRAARGVAAALVLVSNTSANPVPTLDAASEFPFTVLPSTESELTPLCRSLPCLPQRPPELP